MAQPIALARLRVENIQVGDEIFLSFFDETGRPVRKIQPHPSSPDLVWITLDYGETILRDRADKHWVAVKS